MKYITIYEILYENSGSLGPKFNFDKSLKREIKSIFSLENSSISIFIHLIDN